MLAADNSSNLPSTVEYQTSSLSFFLNRAWISDILLSSVSGRNLGKANKIRWIGANKTVE